MQVNQVVWVCLFGACDDEQDSSMTTEGFFLKCQSFLRPQPVFLSHNSGPLLYEKTGSLLVHEPSTWQTSRHGGASVLSSIF